MKKFFILSILFLFGITSTFAKNSKNLLIFEGTTGFVALSINEVVTYNYLFNDVFGIGCGMAFSQGNICDMDFFADVKICKWNLGFGAGYDWAEIFQTGTLLFRAVYHGNNWTWGPGKGGMTIGADWHIPNNSSPDLNFEDALVTAIHLLPRFIIGVSWQLDF